MRNPYSAFMGICILVPYIAGILIGLRELIRYAGEKK